MTLNLYVFVWFRAEALGEHLAGLLRDSDERCPAAQFFEFGSSYVCAGGPQAAQDVPYGVFHIALVRHLD